MNATYCELVVLIHVNITIIFKSVEFASLPIERCKFLHFDKDCDVHMHQQCWLAHPAKNENKRHIKKIIKTCKYGHIWWPIILPFEYVNAIWNDKYLIYILNNFWNDTYCDPVLMIHVNITIIFKTVEFASLQMERCK